jgi:crooked neck
MLLQVPPSSEKRSWRRYVFLWIKYAVFEELDCNDIVRARAVCKAALAVIPHKSFSFSKLWIHSAHLELRARDLAAARLMFGRAIGQAPREKIFKAYIEMELQLGNLDRCRTLYQKFIEWSPENCGAWAR